MTELILDGLQGSHPLGALAALGLLRVVSRTALPQPAKLSWVERPDWVAKLTFPGLVDRALLLQALANDLQSRREAPELTWAEDLKAPLQAYHETASAWVLSLTPESRNAVDFLVAFGSELVSMVTKRDEVKPTALHLTSGQQKFLALIRSLLEEMTMVQPTPKQPLAEALWGPWRYRDEGPLLGWDPQGERLHAYEAKKPSHSKVKRVKAAVWLGFEALPLFPTGAVANRLQTCGFDAKNCYFSWPIWEAPLTLATVRSALSLAELTAEAPNAAALKARGVMQVYRSCRIQDGRYGILRQATRVV
jgi:hypothetical protein